MPRELDRIAARPLIESVATPIFFIALDKAGRPRLAGGNRRFREVCARATGTLPQTLLTASAPIVEAMPSGDPGDSTGETKVRFTLADGTQRCWLLSIARLGGADTSPLWTCTAVDATSEIEGEHRLHDLVEGSLQAICIHRRFQPLIANRAFLDLYGLADMEELHALSSLLDLVPESERDAAWRAWERTLNDPLETVTIRAHHVSRTGFDIWIQGLARHIDWLGEPAQQLSIVDMTEHRRFEQELIDSRDALERQAADLARLAEDLDAARREAQRQSQAAESANHAKSQFLATMSHELRTPLNAILGFSEIIASETFGPSAVPQYPEYARDIHNSGQHLLDLINDILDIAKIEAGKLEISASHIWLDEVLESCLRLNRVRAQEHQVALHLDVPAEAAQLHADERAVKQIVFNLLSNAIKFTPPGGQVTVAALRHLDAELEIRVSDTGIGIAEADLDRVLHPFEQADNSYNRQAGGTGLGLTLVKALTDLHRGRLEISSRPGEGTCVRVFFPEQYLASEQRQAV